MAIRISQNISHAFAISTEWQWEKQREWNIVKVLEVLMDKEIDQILKSFSFFFRRIWWPISMTEAFFSDVGSTVYSLVWVEIGGDRIEFVESMYFLFFLLVYPFCLLVYFLIINWEVVRPKLANFEVKK